MRQLISPAESTGAPVRRDCDAFGELYGEVWRELYRFAFYSLGNREDAEDALQETAAQAYAAFAGLRDTGAFKPWIFTILSARCKRGTAELIRRRKTAELEALDHLSNEKLPPDLLSAMVLREELYRLREDEREIVLLSVIGGYGSAEIAAMLRRPKPMRSGNPGCAPTAAPAALQAATVASITRGSPACQPQATLAEVI